MSKVVQEFFDHSVDEWDKTRYQDETYISRARVALTFLQKLGRGRRVLDLGCGAGHQSLQLVQQGHEVVSVDFSPKMAKATRDRLLAAHPGQPAMVVVADATALPFRPGSFDGLLALGLVGFISDRRGLFAELHRMLKAGGQLVCDAGVPEPEVLFQAVSRVLNWPWFMVRVAAAQLTGRPRPDPSIGWYSRNFIKHSPLEFERLLQAGSFEPFGRGGAGFGELQLGTRSLLPWRVRNQVAGKLSDMSMSYAALARHALTYVVASTRLPGAQNGADSKTAQHASAVRR